MNIEESLKIINERKTFDRFQIINIIQYNKSSPINLSIISVLVKSLSLFKIITT